VIENYSTEILRFPVFFSNVIENYSTEILHFPVFFFKTELDVMKQIWMEELFVTERVITDTKSELKLL
jgi:hypothetical protein